MTSNNNEQTEPEKKPVQKDQEQANQDKPVEETIALPEGEETDKVKQEQEVVDEQPAEPKSKPQPQPQPKFVEKQGKRGVKLGTIAILLSLFIGSGSAYLMNQQNMQHQDQVAQLEAQIKQMRTQVGSQLSKTETTLQSDVKGLANSTRVAIGQQEKSIQSLQVALSEVIGRRPNDWLLAEADYLVKLAGQKLFLEKDVVSATKLMESADQRISALNDPTLVPLRKRMAKDITTLSAVPLIDRDGLTLRLMSLQQQVKALPLANAIIPEAQEVVQEEVSEDINDWQQNLMTSLKDFSEQFITFRTRDGSVIPLLSPKQDFYLRENIKGKLESAIHAVYDENSHIYKASITLANQWAQQFFKQDDPTVVKFQQTLKKLSGQSIEVKYPVKLESQKVLADVISERLRREVTSIITEEK